MAGSGSGRENPIPAVPPLPWKPGPLDCASCFRNQANALSRIRGAAQTGAQATGYALPRRAKARKSSKIRGFRQQGVWLSMGRRPPIGRLKRNGALHARLRMEPFPSLWRCRAQEACFSAASPPCPFRSRGTFAAAQAERIPLRKVVLRKEPLFRSIPPFP